MGSNVYIVHIQISYVTDLTVQRPSRAALYHMNSSRCWTAVRSNNKVAAPSPSPTELSDSGSSWWWGHLHSSNRTQPSSWYWNCKSPWCLASCIANLVILKSLAFIQVVAMTDLWIFMYHLITNKQRNIVNTIACIFSVSCFIES